MFDCGGFSGIADWIRRAQVLREGTTHIVYKPAFCRRKQLSIINQFINYNMVVTNL